MVIVVFDCKCDDVKIQVQAARLDVNLTSGSAASSAKFNPKGSPVQILHA